MWNGFDGMGWQWIGLGLVHMRREHLEQMNREIGELP